MKKLLALLLSISMLIMCAPGLSLVASAAVELEGEGTSESPYLISTADEFLDVFGAEGTKTDLVKDDEVHFKQTAELIVLNDYTPVYADIKCEYDGDGKVIKIEKYNALAMPTDSTKYQQQGLFRRIVGGTVKNLTVEGTIDASVNNNTLVGGIVGYLNGGEIINCVNKVAVTGQNQIGGIAGQLQNSSIINCINRGTVTANNNIVGGIAGCSAGNTGNYITNCANYGTVKRIYDNAKRLSVGGIIGDAGGTITLEKCFNAGNVISSSKAPVSAIVGTNTTATAVLTINDCFNTGVLSNAASFYLLMGGYTTPASGKTFSLTVNNFYDISNPNAALLPAGIPEGNTVTNTYILSEDGANAQAIIDAYATNGAYECVAGDGYDYPNFAKTADVTIAYDSAIGGVFEKPGEPEPDGSEEYPYLIGTEEEFLTFFGKDGEENTELSEGKFFKQTASFTLADYTPADATFNGSYDGDGNTITINEGKGFVTTLTGTIKNLTIAGEINASGIDNVAAFAGNATGATIINCVNEADVRGRSSVGGFFGNGVNVTIKNSVNKGNVIGENSYIGGFIGNASTTSNGTTSIINSGNYGVVRCIHTGGRTSNGGFIGRLSGTCEISKSFNAGDITIIKHTSKPYIAGAFIGVNNGAGRVTLTITDCFNVGKISAGAEVELYADNAVIVGMYEELKDVSQDSFDVTVTNFYDIANAGVKLMPVTDANAEISTTNVIGLNDDILTAFADNAAFEVKEGYAYPNFKLTEEVTVYYNPSLKVSVADLAVVQDTPIFLSSEDTENTEVRTSDTNEIITTAYAVVNGKFTGINTLKGVEYGVLITKVAANGGSKLTKDTATEIAYGEKCITADGTNLYGILIYGENMVPGDRYYVRPFVSFAGMYYYGTPTSFILPEKAE